MAKFRFRAALNAATFPLVALLAGRTVMEPRIDSSVKSPATFYGSPESMEFNTPQLLYCENVLPTAEGLQSVGYEQKIRPLDGAVDFDQAITLRDEAENNFLYVPARGKNYIWDASTGNWNQVTPFVTLWTGKLVTRAYVNGRTFIAFEGRGIYEYDATANTFNLQVVTGLANADIRGIGSSSNYLIVFTDLEVCWSSLVNPLDFVPSLTTGAGRSIPQDVKARITAVLGIAGGFIIYTAKNAIAAVYTNNARAPFTFKEISNAGGIQTYEQVTSEQTSGAQYAWTTGGLQKITIQAAEPVSAEVNDFLAGRMWDSFDSTTKLLTTMYATTTEFPVKLSFISSRFLVVSYSTSADTQLYQWALVFDTVLKRWGKLKVEHTDCFSYPYPNVSGQVTYDDLANTMYDDLTQTTYADLLTGVVSDPPSKLTVAFLGIDGEVQLLRMDYDKDVAQEGVIILGKFQLMRSNNMQLQYVELEGVYQTGSDQPHPLTVNATASLTGYEADRVETLKLLQSKGKYSRWAKRMVGKNINIVLEGTMAMSSYLMEVTQDGDR